MNVVTNPAASKFTAEDIEYHQAGGEVLLARLYRPQGAGPFPAVVGVHGGAWTSGDRNNNQVIDSALAAAGVVVLALDFRLAPKAPYPASVVDVNYGTRWFKAHAEKFGSRADWIGAVASSSGAHQALLSALRPDDPRYASASSPKLNVVDASVAYIVACWPISDPLARYRMAMEKKNERLIQAHKDYFGGEAAMTEGNPQLVLDRGENGRLPPLLILQGTKDSNVTPDMAEKFSAAWRKRGGSATLETFPDQPHAFATQDPTSAESLRAIELIKAFVLKRGGA
ncbi:MAG: alpha/beta hydrolase [Xanthobacteraceae bacterium]|nr:alpha/beta hydrolase [Xanthobacteraceae bacterium]